MIASSLRAAPAATPRCIADGDLSIPALDLVCEVTIDTPGVSEQVVVPECERGADGSYLVDPETDAYRLPADAEVCVALLVDDDISAACAELGANLETVLVTRLGYDVPGGSWIQADCSLSSCSESDCPNMGN